MSPEKMNSLMGKPCLWQSPKDCIIQTIRGRGALPLNFQMNTDCCLLVSEDQDTVEFRMVTLCMESLF